MSKSSLGKSVVVEEKEVKGGGGRECRGAGAASTLTPQRRSAAPATG